MNAISDYARDRLDMESDPNITSAPILVPTGPLSSIAAAALPPANPARFSSLTAAIAAPVPVLFPSSTGGPLSTVVGADGNLLPQWVVDDLAKSGIAADQIAKLGIRHVDPSEYMELFGVSGHGLPDAYLIPFPNPVTGEPMLSEDGKPFYRAKLRHPVQTDDGTQKYLCRKGSGQRAYFPPGIMQMLHGARCLCVTEGEKKSICAVNLGIAVIGLTGNFGWQGTDGGLLPELVPYVEQADSFVFIADSDAASNPAFGDAMRAFAYALKRYDCKLYYCVLPSVLDNGKTGLDDFLLYHGADGAQGLNRWIQSNSRLIAGSERFAKIGAKDWQTPQPLTANAGPGDQWPWDAMPEPLANMAKSVVETMDVDPVVVGLGTMCVASIALANRRKVQIKPGHEQFANIYGLAVMPPAAGKSPLGKLLVAPLISWTNEQHIDYERKLAQWDTQEKIVNAQIKSLENQAKNVCTPTQLDQLRQKIESARSTLGRRPVQPSLFGNDVTSEAVAARMKDNGGGYGIFATEGRKFVKVAKGIYRRGESDIDFYLAAHAGDYTRVQRSNAERPDLVLPEPCLSMFIAIQPDLFQDMGEQSEMTESGFLGRFQFAVSTHLPREYPRQSIPDYITSTYGRTLRGLIGLECGSASTGQRIALVMPMAAAAFEIWHAFDTDIKAQVRNSASNGSCHPAYVHYQGKLTETVARIALLIRAVKHVHAAEPCDQITAQDVQDAMAIARCLQSHAQRAFAFLGDDPVLGTARRLWKILDVKRSELRDMRSKDIGESLVAVKPSDIARYGWAGINEAARVHPILNVLETKGWLRRREFPGRGGRAHDHLCFELHPDPPEHLS